MRPNLPCGRHPGLPRGLWCVVRCASVPVHPYRPTYALPTLAVRSGDSEAFAWLCRWSSPGGALQSRACLASRSSRYRAVRSAMTKDSQRKWTCASPAPTSNSKGFAKGPAAAHTCWSEPYGETRCTDKATLHGRRRSSYRARSLAPFTSSSRRAHACITAAQGICPHRGRWGRGGLVGGQGAPECPRGSCGRPRAVHGPVWWHGSTPGESRAGRAGQDPRLRRPGAGLARAYVRTRKAGPIGPSAGPHCGPVAHSHRSGQGSPEAGP